MMVDFLADRMRGDVAPWDEKIASANLNTGRRTTKSSASKSNRITRR